MAGSPALETWALDNTAGYPAVGSERVKGSAGTGISTELSLCYSVVYQHSDTVVQAVLTSWSTGSGFDLA